MRNYVCFTKSVPSSSIQEESKAHPRGHRFHRLPGTTRHVGVCSTSPGVALLVEPPTDAPEPEHVFQVDAVGYLISVNLTSKDLSPGQLWCGTDWAICLRGNRYNQALKNIYRQYHLRPVTERHHDTFQFGNGQLGPAFLAKTPRFCERDRPGRHKPSGCQDKWRDVS